MKASSFTRSTGTPMIRAATSLSRTAMKLRPSGERTSRIATIVSTVAMDRTSRYRPTGVFRSKPADMQRRGRDHARRAVVREPAELGEAPLQEELGSQGGDREIEAAQPQAWHAEHEADQSSDAAAQDEAPEQRHARHAELDIVGGIGAHGHERCRAERELAGIAREQIETERGEAQHEERRQDRLEQVVAADLRHDQEANDQNGQAARAMARCAKPRAPGRRGRPTARRERGDRWPWPRPSRPAAGRTGRSDARAAPRAPRRRRTSLRCRRRSIRRYRPRRASHWRR